MTEELGVQSSQCLHIRRLQQHRRRACTAFGVHSSEPRRQTAHVSCFRRIPAYWKHRLETDLDTVALLACVNRRSSKKEFS